MRYFIYCRKSSEEEERQALSIKAQLKELRDYAKKQGLLIVDEFVESKSARKPNNRLIFDRMLQKIEEKVADGILSWAPDRLSRNSIEGGKVIYLVDQGAIKDLKFPTFQFYPDPQGLFNLSLAFGLGKLYVDNLSQNVKRGIREKIRRGEYPGPAPIGYINNFKQKNIKADPEHFNFVKKVIESYANGSLNFSEIAEKMYKSGIRTKKGNHISYSTVQKMLLNPFYYGVFKYKDELHQGSHPPMISKETFDQIQKRLKEKSRTVDWSKQTRNDKGFLFSEPGKCGECGYTIVREYHRKKSGLEFRYYRCSKKSRTHKCQQKPINEKDLAKQVENLVSEVAVDDYWYDWCMNEITEWKNQEENETGIRINEFQDELNQNKEKLEKLLDIHLEGVIDSTEYTSKKNKFVNKNSVLEAKIRKIRSGGSEWFEPLAESLKISNQAFHSIQNKNYIQMGKFLKKVGLNSTFQEKSLSITFFRPFCFFREAVLGLRNCGSPQPTLSNKKLETQTTSGGSDKSGCVSSCDVAPSLLPSREAARCPRATAGSPRAVVGVPACGGAEWQGM